MCDHTHVQFLFMLWEGEAMISHWSADLVPEFWLCQRCYNVLTFIKAEHPHHHSNSYIDRNEVGIVLSFIWVKISFFKGVALISKLNFIQTQHPPILGSLRLFNIVCAYLDNVKSKLNEASDIKPKPRLSSSVATDLLFLDCLNLEKESQECFESFGVQLDCHQLIVKALAKWKVWVLDIRAELLR